MGCGGSKFEPGEDMPAALRPLRRRIEEIKRLRLASARIGDSTLSTKVLLQEDGDSGDSNHTEPEKTSSSPNGSVSVAPEEKPEVIIQATTDEMKTDLEKTEIEDESYGHIFLPGSPSFREYCLNSARDSDSDETDSVPAGNVHDDAAVKSEEEGASQSKDSVGSANSSEEMTEKKRGRFRSFTRGSMAVYTCLNVRNCYTSPTSHESPRLLDEKVA